MFWKVPCLREGLFLAVVCTPHPTVTPPLINQGGSYLCPPAFLLKFHGAIRCFGQVSPFHLLLHRWDLFGRYQTLNGCALGCTWDVHTLQIIPTKQIPLFDSDPGHKEGQVTNPDYQLSESGLFLPIGSPISPGKQEDIEAS